MSERPGHTPKEQIPSRRLIIVDSHFPGAPDALPPFAHIDGYSHRGADIVRLKGKTPSILILSPEAFEYVAAYADVDRSPSNERMGKATNGEGRNGERRRGPQFDNLHERDERRERMNKSGQHIPLAHIEVGRMLSRLPERFGDDLDRIAREFVRRNSGKVFDTTDFARGYVNEAIWLALFNPIFTKKEVDRIADFVPRSFTPLSLEAFLGDKIKFLTRTLYAGIYKERDEILELMGAKTEMALQRYPDSLPVQIWNAFHREGIVEFDGDEERAREHAKLNTEGYQNTLFQAAADTTTGPLGNIGTLLGKEENQGMADLLEENDEALGAAAYVALGLNSSLPSDPHILVESLTIEDETFPAGTSIGFNLASIAERELERFTGLSVHEHSYHELVLKTIEVCREKGISTHDKALKSLAFKKGIKGSCLGNGLAVREIEAYIKALAGNVRTVTEGYQVATLLLNRMNSSILIN